ncbi:MAG: hypothetical protein GEV28_03500 [Actinophytocola sp.]|uniref:hypothetical protein n=1 Tax=Actinophytocola sp. TaxID=1872138 RepID=UPI0013207BFA|nr:hypothetical protein [Actinophytocola sp.]MPZ79500.1 hypothetical protein [Actinophytocola sp.]
MAEPTEVQDALRALRRRVGELEVERIRAVGELRHAIAGTGLAIGMLTLTATTWAAERDGDDPHTLWGMVPTDWVAVATLILVAGTALATIGLFLTDPPSRVGHLVLVSVSLLTAVAALVVGVVPPESYGSGPGRWLTLLGALALAATHGFRAEEMRGALRR